MEDPNRKPEGTPYKVCRKHHPSVPASGATAKHVADAHRAAMGSPEPAN